MNILYKKKVLKHEISGICILKNTFKDEYILNCSIKLTKNIVRIYD